MIDLLAIVLRASVVVLAALGASAALRRQSAGLRHCVLAAGIFSAAAVVPLSLTLPVWDLPVQSRPLVEWAGRAIGNADTTVGDAAQAEAPRARVAVESLVAALWSVGFAISVMGLVVGVTRLARLTKRAVPLTDYRWLALNAELSARYRVNEDVALLETDVPGVLATWGVRRPCVLLPAHCESWSDARIRVVLSHELAHIRRGDWCIQIAAETIRSAFWFNPLFWLACTRLRREGEQACDDAVLDGGVPAAEYASDLLEIARTCRPPSAHVTTAMPIARPSTLEWRITAMLNPRLSHTAPSRRAMAIALAALVALAVPVAAFRASAQGGPLPLVGTVYDMSGAVLPQVVLTLEDAAGLKQEATTDGAGRFEFAPVGIGRYVLSSSIPGFLPLRQEVNLKDARNWERAITLQVGSLQETITVREQRPSGAPMVTTTAREPLRVGGNIRAPKKIRDVRPVYPPAMRDGGFEGVVPMEVQIGIDGTVASVRVSSAQVHPELAKAAVDAVRQWRFSPTLLNGFEVEVFMMVSVQFSLPN